jgi:predicted glycosyltransferase
MRFLFYSHDGLGLGHTRRHLAIAKALTQQAPDVSVLLASGAEEIIRFGLPPHVDVLKLPGLRKITNEQYLSRRLQMSASEIRSLRSALLETAVKSFRPTVVLADKHPFGAKGEFRDGLEALRAQGGRAVLGLRDILDQPSAVLQEWAAYDMQELITEFFDLVLIYGEQTVFDPISAYEFSPGMAERTRFCGYVVDRDQDEMRGELTGPLEVKDRSRPVVLGTAGGGEDGFFLLETFIRASAGAPWQAIAVAGPMTSRQEYRRLKNLAARAQVSLYTFVPNLPRLFSSVDALVTMGGYNSLAEAASKGVPTVCVPRTTPRLEQWLRATAFERIGLLSVLRPEELSTDNLRHAIRAATSCSREELRNRARGHLGFDGAAAAAAHLLALAADPAFVPASVDEKVMT